MEKMLNPEAGRPDLPAEVQPLRRASTGDIRIVFDHLPKTAGRSLIQALSAIVPAMRAHRLRSGPHRQVLLNPGDTALVAGHLWFAPGERLEQGWYYATVLREPVDRFLSHYCFSRNDFNAPEDRAAAATRVLSLDEYVQVNDPDLLAFYSNVQARHFAPLALAPDIDPSTLADGPLLAAAQSALEGYSLVGVYAELQGFVELLCHDWGLQPPASIPVINVTSGRLHRGDLAPATRNRIEAANRVDAELYLWAAARFRNRQAQQFERHSRIPAAGAASVDLAPASFREHAGAKEEHGARFDTTRRLGRALSFGSREIEIGRVTCREDPASCKNADPQVSVLRIEIECLVHEGIGQFTVGIALLGNDGQTVFGTNTHQMGIALAATSPGIRNLVFSLKGSFAPGRHTVTVALHRGAAHTSGCFHWKDDAAEFAVEERPQPTTGGPIVASFSETP
jgi:hypothetical protein